VTGLSYPGADSYVEIGFTGSVELNCDRKPIYIELDIKENSPDRNFDQSNDFSNNNYYTPFLPEEFFASEECRFSCTIQKNATMCFWPVYSQRNIQDSESNSDACSISFSFTNSTRRWKNTCYCFRKYHYTQNQVLPLLDYFEPADIGFPHEGSIDVGFSPRKKEALILLDSSYESNDVDDGPTGIFNIVCSPVVILYTRETI